MSTPGPSIEARIKALNTPAPAPEPAEPAPPPAEEATADAPESPPISVTPDESEVVVSDAPAEGEASASTVDAAFESDEELVQVSDLRGLAEHLGIDVADLYQLSIPMPDGAEPVTIGQIKDAASKSQVLERREAELAKEREAWTAEQKALRESYEKRIQEAASLAQAAEKRLMADMEGIDWNGLRESDPSEWAARRQEYAERKHQIDMARHGVEQAIAQARQEHQEQAAQKQQEFIARERETLLEKLPEWKDPEKAKAEIASLREYLGGQGFTDSEIDQAYDHRIVMMAHKARLYDEMTKSAEVAKKRVIQIGRKRLTPGNPRGKQTAREDAAKQLQARLRKTGKVEDAAAAIAARRRG